MQNLHLSTFLRMGWSIEPEKSYLYLLRKETIPRIKLGTYLDYMIVKKEEQRRQKYLSMDKSKIAMIVVLACLIICGCGKSTLENIKKVRMPIDVEDKLPQDLSIEGEKKLYGEWQINRAVLKSNMYTGTSLDGDFENYIFDPEDYVGYILRYSEESFSLGDVEFANPSYLVSKITVAEYNEGGDFRNPDLYTIITEEEIEVGGDENTLNLSQVELMRIDMKFDYKTDYQDYPFIPVGTQVVLLNSNTMVIGVWGKVLLAYRIQ